MTSISDRRQVIRGTERDLSQLAPGGFVAHPRQAARISERRSAATFCVHGGVYDCGADTELVATETPIKRSDVFLDIGCGNGAASILLAMRSRGGVGIDISDRAVRNATCNAQRHGVKNVIFAQGDVFGGVDGKFNVVICNPPYSSSPAKDQIEMMFWDTANHMKERFFHDVRRYLARNGRVYFGWATFSDIDSDLPLRSARKNGLILTRVWKRAVHTGLYSYLLLEFRESGLSLH